MRAQWPQQPLEALAADGQRLNGAHRNSEDHFETVILVRHQEAIPIAVRSCREAGGEPAAMRALWEEVDIRGTIITVEALHPTKALADLLGLTHGAPYRFPVKKNHPELHQFLKSLDWDQDAQDSFTETPEKGNGRIGQRTIPTYSPLKGAITWPQVGQVFRSLQPREPLKGDQPTRERVYGVTSLTREAAEAQRWRELHRGHWPVENGNHRRREGIFGEDNCLRRTCQGTTNQALFNHLALAIIFRAG